MSYARFLEPADDGYGTFSDVYIYLCEGERRHLHCCHVKSSEPCFMAHSTREMLEHLLMHSERGDALPRRTWDGIYLDRIANDRWLSGVGYAEDPGVAAHG